MKIYLLFAMDPYEEHDCPSFNEAYTTREAAEKAMVDKFEYTFGRGSAETWERYGRPAIKAYWQVIEVDLKEEWVVPQWMQDTFDRREKEQTKT